MRFHFFHAADIHLDRSLNGLRASECETVQRLLLAPRLAFSNLVDEVIASAAAFLVLPGDIYDGAWKDSSTGLFFNAQMGRLREAGIPVYVLHGNHDAVAAMPKTVHPPDNVFVFGSAAPHTYRLDAYNVALHGQSFATADVSDNLVTGYPPAVPGMLNIGLLHTAIEGAAPHAPYAPCTLEQLVAKGYDYWALGHVHSHKILCESPWITFPGNLQGLHVNEPGPKGALKVTVVDGVVQSVEQQFVDVLRWCAVCVDLTDVAEQHEIWRRVLHALQEANRQAGGRHLCVRVTLTGATPLHPWLRVHPGQVEMEVLAQAAAIGDGISIERVRIETSDAVAGKTLEHGDALDDLQGFLDEAARDADFLASMRDAFAKVALELPDIDADTHPDLARIRSGALDALATAKKHELIYRIQGS